MKTISPLTTEQLPQAFTIEQASHAFPWSEKTLFSNQGERYLNLQIEVDQVMVGFAITQVVLDEATLFNIAIAPNYQGQGLGRQLLDYLILQLQQRDVLTLWLEVRASNNKAIRLYQSMGFNEASVRHNYYPAQNGREDAIIMALAI